MSEETDDLIKENIRLTRENNRLVRKLWKAHVWGVWSKVFILACTIGIPVLLYQYYLSDVVAEMMRSYTSFQEEIQKIKELPASISVSTVLNGLEEKRKELIE